MTRYWMFLLVLMGLGMAFAAKQDGPPFPRIANCYGVGLTPDSTSKDIEEVARFDLLIGGVWCNWSDAQQRQRLAEKIAAVRKLNPHIIILDFSSSAPYHDPKDSAFPKDGWLLQPNGKHILGWPGTEMINLMRSNVIDFLARRSLGSVKEKGFDGTFIDCMGSGFDWWACNIEHHEPYGVDANGDGKADERKWLDEQWVKAKTELSRKVREMIGDNVPFMTNQAGDWGTPSMNGILLEDYLDYVLDGNASWDWAFGEYQRWCRQSQKPNVTTIVSSSGIEPPYDPWRTMTAEARNALLEKGRQRLNRMRFGLATTLMDDGYFAYDLHTRWRGQRWWYPEFDAPLGYPKGAAAKQPDGTWRRAFDGGAVIVNPTLFDAVVRFDNRRRDVSSGKVDKEFIIPSRDGRIFLPTNEPVARGTLSDPQPVFTFAGPEPIVERDEQILCRLKGLATLFDAQGRLRTLTDGKRVLLENVQPVIVSDNLWRNFEFAECRHQRLSDGRLLFTGKRVEGAVSLSYEQEVRLLPHGIDVHYRWTTLTDAHLHSFRQQCDFPVTQFGGGRFRTAQTEGALPRDRAPSPLLANELNQVTMIPPQGSSVTVTLSGKAALVDERHYGVPGYRMGYVPVSGDLKAGKKWEYVVQIRIGER